MVVDLSGVEVHEQREYIKQEGHYTLKCVEVKDGGFTANGNPVIKLVFKTKQDEYFIEDVVITPKTKWKIKQLASAFGFEYDNVNMLHFKDMFCVGWIVPRVVQNKYGENVQVFRCAEYKKSKIENTIPPENTPVASEDIPEIPDSEIPF